MQKIEAEFQSNLAVSFYLVLTRIYNFDEGVALTKYFLGRMFNNNYRKI